MVYIRQVIKGKKTRIQATQSKFKKRDILTEMFEEFGIKVIDVSNQNPKLIQKNNYLKKSESQKRLL